MRRDVTAVTSLTCDGWLFHAERLQQESGNAL